MEEYLPCIAKFKEIKLSRNELDVPIFRKDCWFVLMNYFIQIIILIFLIYPALSFFLYLALSSWGFYFILLFYPHGLHVSSFFSDPEVSFLSCSSSSHPTIPSWRLLFLLVSFSKKYLPELYNLLFTAFLAELHFHSISPLSHKRDILTCNSSMCTYSVPPPPHPLFAQLELRNFATAFFLCWKWFQQ
jgi:hypothetical protein